METIEQYVNALFAKLPASLEILRLRDQVLEQAREMFERLRQDGMNAHEAAGSVLSSLGTLEDIFARHGVPYPSVIDRPAQEASEPVYDETEALDDETEDYLDAQYNIARMNALGVVLCICAPVCPIFFDDFPYLFGWWMGDTLSAIGFFGCIAVAVMLFIYANSMHKTWRSYPYSVHLTAGMREELRSRAADYAAQRTSSIALGVGLCIFSPAAAALFQSSIGAALMFAAIAAGVYLFILSGARGKACRKLLKGV